MGVVQNVFSLISTQGRLTHEQRLRVKADSRPGADLSESHYKKWIK